MKEQEYSLEDLQSAYIRLLDLKLLEKKIFKLRYKFLRYRTILNHWRLEKNQELMRLQHGGLENSDN